METIAVIPLTGYPFHEGHWDIGRKAAKSFDKVIYALGFNPEKSGYNPDKRDILLSEMSHRKCLAEEEFISINKKANEEYRANVDQFEFDCFSGFLVDYIEKVKATAVVRGIRGIDDIGHEMKQQFWNEDLGMETPTFLVIADRNLQHISSSGIRQYRKVKETTDSELSPGIRTPLFDYFITPTDTWPSP